VTSVREARPDDLDWLIAQLREFSQFFGSRIPLFQDEAFARTTLAAFIAGHFVRIAEQANCGPVGFIAGGVGRHWMNPEIRTLAEAFWWVAPQHRRSRAGVVLLNEFVDWGRKNVDWIEFALEDNSPVKPETLLKRGFRFKEHNYLLEVG